MQEIKGTITKGIGGFYYVSTSLGIIECRARGIFRKQKITPLVGDEVTVTVNKENSKTGAIEGISERKSRLIRPAVANVTQMVAVCAVENPRPSCYVLDKLIASAEFINLKIAICFNKSDLSENRELAEIYENAGFRVIVASAQKNEGISELRDVLKDEITVFAGNSGVGKSSLLNCLLGEELFKTGEVSSRVERGKHTTRHSELVKLPQGGFIIDTPGFSSFDLCDISPEELPQLFREFGKHTGNCRFLDCRHISEPNCGVIEAVNEGKIAPSRHESYKLIMEEIKNSVKR